MGQKVNPKSFRLGTVYTWDSHWYAEKDFSKLLRQDILIKDFLKKKMKNMGLAKVEIKRSGNTVDLDIYSSRPGMVIGRGGAGIEELKNEIIKRFFKEYFTSKTKPTINLNIKEIKIN